MADELGNTVEGQGNAEPKTKEPTTNVDEGQVQDDAKGDEPKGDDAKGDEPEVPEKYEFNAPEGVEFDEELTGQLSEVCRELRLPQEGAQKFADMGVALMQKQQAAIQENHRALVDGWAKTAEKDPEIGGNAFKESIQVAQDVLRQYGSPEFTNLLNETGLGNHPEMIRLLTKVGKLVGEDSTPQGDAPSTDKARADLIFG